MAHSWIEIVSFFLEVYGQHRPKHTIDTIELSTF